MVLAVDGCIVEPVIGTIVCTVLSDAVSGEEVGKECHGLFDTPVSPDDDEVHLAVPDAREIDVPTAKLPRAACGSHLELRATVCRIAMSDVRSRACSAAVAVHAVWDAAAGCPSAEADARASRRLQMDGAAQGGYDAAQGGSDASQSTDPCEDVCGSACQSFEDASKPECAECAACRNDGNGGDGGGGDGVGTLGGDGMAGGRRGGVDGGKGGAWQLQMHRKSVLQSMLVLASEYEFQ